MPVLVPSAFPLPSCLAWSSLEELPTNMELDRSKLSDHELLILLHAKQEQMGIDIKDIKDDTKEKLAQLSAKVDALEQHKVDKTEFVTLQKSYESQGRQIGRLTNYLWFAFGAMAILQIALTVYLNLRK